MSIRKAWYVACDGPCGGDPAQISCVDAKDARRMARGEGFVRLRKDGALYDICPRCEALEESQIDLGINEADAYAAAAAYKKAKEEAK